MVRIDATLQDLVLEQWPDLAARLGERRAAFLQRAAAGAEEHGLSDPACAARYLNLCFAFGPGFERRAGNEWAGMLLSDQRLPAWTRIQQVVERGVLQLQGRGDAAESLQASDRRLLDAVDALQAVEPGGTTPEPGPVACDLHFMELHAHPAAPRQQYEHVHGRWRLQPVPQAGNAVTIDAMHPMPPGLALVGDSRIGLRLRVHAACGERHPRVRWIDAQGLRSWRGGEALDAQWSVPAPGACAQAHAALAEETAPSVAVLEVDMCGVRQEGLPLGPQRTRVASYPCGQWLFALERPPEAALQWSEGSGQPPLPAGSSCRLELDGQPVDASSWRWAFDEALQQALLAGLDQLRAQWQRERDQAGVQASASLFEGSAAIAWGWREGPAGLASEPVLRVIAELAMTFRAKLHLQAQVEHEGSRAAVALRAGGSAPLDFHSCREQARQSLLDTVLPAVVQARWPFELNHAPVARADGRVWCGAGPCSGALVLEAGLRPRLAGGSGWEWFALLRIEPVSAPVRVHDPALGQSGGRLKLLPAMTLLDWSAG